MNGQVWLRSSEQPLSAASSAVLRRAASRTKVAFIAFLGDAGAWFFLWTVGRKVPAHERT
jgi:hypothetical protein